MHAEYTIPRQKIKKKFVGTAPSPVGAVSAAAMQQKYPKIQAFHATP